MLRKWVAKIEAEKVRREQRRTEGIIILAALSAAVLLISNLAATKLWDFFGIAVDGGIIIFPLSYIMGDVIVEIFGEKTARSMILASFATNILAVLVFMAVQALPPYPGWDGQEAFETILGFTPRIVAGSLLAYLASQLLNNFVFEKIRKKTGAKHLFIRSLGSSVFAHLVDSAIFETVAFIGVLSFNEFLAQAGFAYIAGMVLEVILTPLTYLAVSMVSSIFCPRYESERGSV